MIEISYTKLWGRCCGCDEPAMHSVQPKGSALTFHLCCACYVQGGNPPADWHPGCVAAAQMAMRSVASQ